MFYCVVLTSVRMYLVHLLSCCFFLMFSHLYGSCCVWLHFKGRAGHMLPQRLGVLAAGRPSWVRLGRFPSSTQIPPTEEPLLPGSSPHPHTGQYRSERAGPSFNQDSLEEPLRSRILVRPGESCVGLNFHSSSSFESLCFPPPVVRCSWSSRWAGLLISYFMEDFVKYWC